MTTPTFEAFQATRRDVPNLAAALPDCASYFENEDGTTRVAAGMVYAGDCYIERLADGRYYLVIYNEEFFADSAADIERLERELYQWLLDEGAEWGVSEFVA